MRNIIPVITFFFFLGCANKTQENGENVLPKDKMIQILLDLHLTEANTDAANMNSKEVEMQKLAMEYEKIFKKNGITSKEFYSTFEYYLNHPAEMDSVYKELVDVATQRQSELLKSMQNRIEPDSIAH